jgi:hypothetical protein
MVAGLLHALVEQNGPAGYRVETKAVTVSDESARAAGDIQIMTGNTVFEASEVTAGAWESKISGVGKAMRDYDLSRIHIVAGQEVGDHASVIAALLQTGDDISVLDLRGFVSTVLSALRRVNRGRAIGRLYDCLDRLQDDLARVNTFVDLLHKHALTIGAVQ